MAENISDEKRAENLVNQLKNGLEQAEGYILGELIKIGQANENKKIEVNDEKVKNAITSLIYALPDPNRPTIGVLSVAATIQDGEEKIKKWIKGNEENPSIEAKYFDSIKKEMADLPKKLENELSTQEGIDNAIKNRIKNNVILQQVGFFKSNGDQLVPLNAIEKNAVVNKIEQNIKIPDGVVSATLQNEKALISPLREMITKRATECFGEKGKDTDGICIIDEKKLTPKNIEKFTNLVNEDMQHFNTVQESIVSKLKPEEIQEKGTEIVKNFAPLLESKNEKLAKATEIFLKSIDPAYLAENSKNIAENLQQATKTNLWEKIKTIIFRQDVVGKKLEKVTGEHVLKNNEYVEKEINNKIFSNAIPENRAEIPTEAIRVKQQMQEQLPPPPPPPEEDIPPPPPPKLPNPNKEKKLPPPPPPEVTTGIVQPQVPQVKPVSLPKTPTSTWQQEVINQEKNQRGGGRGA